MEVVLIVFVGTIVGFFLISMIRRPPAYLAMRGVGHPDIDDDQVERLGNLSLEEFETMLQRFVTDYIGLDIDVVDHTARNEIEIRARDDKPMVGGLYIVHGMLRSLDDFVGPESVMSLKDVVKEEGALKGFLITNGVFAAPAAQMLDAQKLELINGPTLLQLMSRGSKPA